MDLTSHSSTPVLGVSSVTDVVFSGDRKKPTANMPRPPKDLKILKQESMVQIFNRVYSCLMLTELIEVISFSTRIG